MSNPPIKNPVQSNFIKQLKDIVPPNVSLADELAEILGVSIDSAYRRLRGETALSIDEVYKICSKYSISVDSVFSSGGNSATFDYIKLIDSAANLEKYLDGILSHLKKITPFGNKQIIYAAEEIPVFHSFYSEKLTAFKLFYWQRSVLNVTEYQNKKFEFGIVPESLMNIGKKISMHYQSIPSIEIWTDETILTATKQIEYYIESGIFGNKADALAVIDELKKMIKNLESAAEQGNKNFEQNDDSKNYQLYKSDVVIGTNCIHVNAGDSNFAFISFNTLNSLTTANQSFCAETEHWMKNLIRKSTLISGTAEKQRFRFFDAMYRHIDASIEKIKNLST